MKPSPDNYTKEVLGCCLWILLFIVLFSGNRGDRILIKIRQIVPAANTTLSKAAPRPETSSSEIEFAAPHRQWHLTDGSHFRGRVIAIDEDTGKVTIESEEGETKEGVLLESFSQEDREFLLRQPSSDTEN